MRVVQISGLEVGVTTNIDLSPFIPDEIAKLLEVNILRTRDQTVVWGGSAVPVVWAGSATVPVWAGSATPVVWAGSATPVVWDGSATPVVWAGSVTAMAAWAGSALSVQWVGSANALHGHSAEATSLGSITSTAASPALLFAGDIEVLGVGSFAVAGITPMGSAADLTPAGSAADLIPAGSFAAFTPIGSAPVVGVAARGSFGAITGTRITDQWIWNNGALDIAHTTPGASSVTLSGRRQIHLGSPLYSTDTLQLTVLHFREGGIF